MTVTRTPAATDLDPAVLTAAGLDRVAALAAAEHARDRRRDHLLGPATADPSVVRPLLDGLHGTLLPGPDRVASAWLGQPAGGAMAAPVHGVVGDPDGVRAAYAEQAADWVAAGHRTHTAVVRAADRERHDALVDLGFGHEQAYAALDLTAPATDTAAAPADVVVRPGTPEDLAAVVRLAPVIGRHQVTAPVFARVGEEFFDQLEQSHREELADPDAHYLLAEADGVVQGFAIWYDGLDGPFMSADWAELSVAAVAPEARGRGIGLALTAAVLDAARERGISRVATDWRTTNLLSSRFWPARGFRVVGYRMARTIDVTPA